MNTSLTKPELIYPVFTARGHCLTEMYAGFDYTKYRLKRENRNGRVTTNLEIIAVSVDKRHTKKRAPTKVITRKPGMTIGYTPPPRVTAADHGLKVLPNGDGI